jgi:hypothetical protein
MKLRKKYRDMSYEEKYEYREYLNNARWERAVQSRAYHSPYAGMGQPGDTKFIDGMIKTIPHYEYVSGPCVKCKHVDNYCIWDNRFGKNSSKNYFFCQTCFIELVDWISLNKNRVDYDIHQFMDVPLKHYISPVAEG